MTTRPTPFSGCWRIDWMKAWDQEAIDTMGHAFVSFTGASGGYFRFICVEGDLHCVFSTKGGRPHAEWTWNGQDEMDPANGRGWAELQADGSLKGRIYIHHADDSEFTATRSDRDLNTGSSPPPYRPQR